MSTGSAQPVTIADEDLNDPRSRTAFRRMKALAGCYLALSLLTLVAIVLLRDDASVVNDAVWVRGTIVIVSAAFTLAFAVRAARGSHGAYRRLRIVSAVMVVAIALIVSLPDPFPLWMKIEQAACGLVLVGVCAIVNGRHLRSLFAAR